MRRSALILVTVSIAIGCGASVRECGTVDGTVPHQRSVAATECLWSAYERRGSARLVWTEETVEGDPITRTVTVRHGEKIEVRVESRDRFGLSGVFVAVCTDMSFTPVAGGFPFRFDRCTGDVTALQFFQ